MGTGFISVEGLLQAAKLGVRTGTSPEASLEPHLPAGFRDHPDPSLLTHGSELPPRASSPSIAGLGRGQAGLS